MLSQLVQSVPALHACILTAALVGLAAPHRGYAQAPSDTLAVIETVSATLDALNLGEEADARLIEQLTDRARNPLNLNTASANVLAELPLLTALMARRIAETRTQDGAFASWEDVAARTRLPALTLAQLKPYVYIGAVGERPRNWSAQALRQNLRGQFIQRVTRRLDLGRGYNSDSTRTTYRGSPERIYTRLAVEANDRLHMNLTLDKDPGESFEWRPSSATYGFDHVAGHVAIHQLGRVERLIVGDFAASFGQGVTLWQGFSFGKSRSPVRALIRQGRGLDGYGSTEENRFFRGAAASVRLHPAVQLSGFASRRRLDARIDDAPLLLSEKTDRAFILSLAESGLHRTQTELEQKDAALEETVGGNLSYETNQLSVGAVGYWTRYAPARTRGTRPSDRFDPTGRSWHAVGVHGNALWDGLQLFGEVTRVANGAVGGLGGIQIDASRWAEALLLGRHYPARFSNPHGRAFGERSGATQNETGLYAGLSVHLHPEFSLSAYFDQYRFPWLRFGVSRPTAGYEARVIAEHAPYAWLSHYVQFRTETKEQAAVTQTVESRVVEAVRPETRQSWRWHGRFTFSDQLHFRTRVEAVRYRTPTEAQHGVMLYQGIRWTPRPRVRFDGRIALFETSGFGARIYAYEHNVLYAFSIPVFSGRGQRSYLKARYAPVDRLTIEAKYAVSRFQDVDSVGSGLEEVAGNRRRDLSIQVRWTW